MQNKDKICHLYLISILIFFFGLILRLWHLNKVNGLWYDEYYTYFTTINSFLSNKINFYYSIINDHQPPLYYFLLSIWIRVFGDGDYFLRLFSVVFGALTIPVIYFSSIDIGKYISVKNKIKFSYIPAILSSIFFTINSLSIYYSQEVRVYSFSIFISSLVILAFIRLIRRPDSFYNFVFFILINIIFLYTYLLSPIFLFFEFIILTIILYREHRFSKIKPFLISLFIIFISYLPILSAVISKSSENALFNTTNDFINLFIIAISYLSPNAIIIKLSGISNLVIIFTAIIISIFGLYSSIKKHKKIRYLLLLLSGYSLTLIYLGLIDKIVLIPRYFLIILPIIVIMLGYGFSTVSPKNQKRNLLLATILISLNIFWLISSPYSTPKLPKVVLSRNVKYFADTLNQTMLSNKDSIIYIDFYSADNVIKNYKYADLSDINIFTQNVWENHNEVFQENDDVYKDKRIEDFRIIQKESLDKTAPNHNIVLIINGKLHYIYKDNLSVLKKHAKLIQKTNPGGWKVYLFQKK